MERALQEITSRLREIRELIEVTGDELDQDIDVFEARARELTQLGDDPSRNLDEEARAALEDFCSRNLQQAARCCSAHSDVEVPPSEVGTVGIKQTDAGQTEALAGCVCDTASQAAVLDNALGGHA